MLLELLSGRRAIDKTKPQGEERLVRWARPYLNDRKRFYRIMDSRLEGEYSRAGAFVAATLALECVCEAKSRPTMSEVVNVLERILSATDTAGPSQSVQLSSPTPVLGPSQSARNPISAGRSPTPAATGNPSPLLLSPRGSSLPPALSPQLPA